MRSTTYNAGAHEERSKIKRHLVKLIHRFGPDPKHILYWDGYRVLNDFYEWIVARTERTRKRKGGLGKQ